MAAVRFHLPSLLRRTPLLALCLTLCGCGVSQNPSLFAGQNRPQPKPPLFGALRDFDVQASRLQVVPPPAGVPVQTQQLLIATVYDEHDRPLPRRRVEWMLEGVGNIVEVGESGLLGGRGAKIDPRYAVGYTEASQRTVTRGTSDTADDVSIGPGQTWCVISSAVEGDTHVTVYAPEILNWDRHKVTITAHWVDAEWRLPPPVVGRAGTPTLLTTQVTRRGDHAPLPGVRVRYRVLDGPPALLLPSQTPDETAVTDASGNAAVPLVQTAATTGTNRIAIDIVRPPDATKPGELAGLIGQGETRVDWQGPQLTLTAAIPPTVAVAQEAAVSLNVSNTGQVETQALTLKQTIPDGWQYLRSDPPATVDGAQLVWTFGGLAAGKGHTVQVAFRAAKPGPASGSAVVTTRDGLREERPVNTLVTVPQIAVKLNGPATALLNGLVAYDITLSNPGSGAATNVYLLDEFEGAVEEETKTSKVKRAMGTLAPGESKVVPIKLTVKQAGQLVHRVTASADGNLVSKAEQPVAVRRAVLAIDMAGPRRGTPGQPADWRIIVSNRGEAALGNVAVRQQLPAELVYVSATPTGTLSGSEVTWSLGTLQPGEKKELQVRTNALRPSPRALTVALATADPGITVQAEAPIEILGLPAFRLKVRDTQDPVEVNGRTTYQIEVLNQGTLVGNQVQVTAVVPAQFIVVGGYGPGRPRSEGNRLIFPAIDALAPGQALNYTVDVQAVKPGDARFQAELRTTTLRDAVIEEESTTVTQGTAAPASVAPVGGRLTAVPVRP